MLHDLFSFQGRLNRGSFWIYNLMWITLIVLLALSSTLITENSPMLMVIAPLFIAVYIGAAISQISLYIKRLHDLGRSGYHYFLFLIPFYNIYLALLLGFKRGSLESNQYGESRI